MDIKRIRKKSYEWVYAHRFDNLDKMNQFLEKHNFSKLTEEEIDNANISLSSQDIEYIKQNT